MTNEQIVAITAPMAFDGAIIGLLVLWMRAKFEAIDKRFDAESARVNARFGEVGQRFDSINQRFDDMRDLWRAGRRNP